MELLTRCWRNTSGVTAFSIRLMNYGRVKLWIETQFCGCINRVENNLPCVKENFSSSWFLLRFLTPTNLGHLGRDTCWVPWGLLSSSRELRPNWSSTWETQRDRATPDRRFYSLWPCLPDSPAPPSRPCFSALLLGPSSRPFLPALPPGSSSRPFLFNSPSWPSLSTSFLDLFIPIVRIE